MVTACASSQHLVLGQVKVNAYSNNVTEIHALLEVLDITAAIIPLAHH
ncbi:MAG: hypothetical protein DSM107014_13180 [Gomphosphaeria aponina SAG 52.96 = DSM 107014]|uniref:Uncharacterized protein n=1 Tax=Gomphosphaeria aponina SAG 52.96 = DSM 107014 TaxID=1521640 RepID=A0A941GYQ0_9CHRO|nr:hypothetical protein [Gomphosphaeria aponina SAG 52.96 = DSM 107014]